LAHDFQSILNRVGLRAFEALPDIGDRRRAKPRPTDGFLHFHR